MIATTISEFNQKAMNSLYYYGCLFSYPNFKMRITLRNIHTNNLQYRIGVFLVVLENDLYRARIISPDLTDYNSG